jgi:hypothetical protein
MQPFAAVTEQLGPQPTVAYIRLNLDAIVA